MSRRFWLWVSAAVFIGLFPAGLAYATGWGFAHPVTAVLTVLLVAGAAYRDSTVTGCGIMVVVVASQSLLILTLAIHDPDGLAVALPSGAAYWDESHHWIRTGENPEYELGTWLPSHARLLLGTALLTYVSLGLTPLARGLEQVDMMNFYVGRLIAHSESPWVAGVFGWHLWSICRGIGCLFIIFELLSLSLERLSGIVLSTRRRRAMRWAAGISFFLMDAGIKYTCMESVRTILANNLSL